MAAKPRERADLLVVERGLAPSRERARALILAGRVEVDGRRVDKAGDLLPRDASLSVRGDAMPFVSRGGLKLAHALDRFGVAPSGRRCLDVGASTGGFTDCLLQRGAAHVVAADVGRGQLDWSLQRDDRVTPLRVNARHLEPPQVGEAPSLVTADVSFISLTKVLPAVVRCAPEAELVLLVKPQFEAGRERVGKGGVVKDPETWRGVLLSVGRCLASLGVPVVAATASPVLGPAGNREFFLHARPGGSPADLSELVARAVSEAAGEYDEPSQPAADAGETEDGHDS